MSNSKPKSKSHSKSKKPIRPAATPSALPRPWVIGGIDYGPAMAAVADLATWAFELAARDVHDWPEGQRRVRNAQRYVIARMRGRASQFAPTDDVLFAAGLLSRIFEADLSLGMSEMVTILDELGLPTEVVPLMPRSQASARSRAQSDVVPFPPRRPAPAAQQPLCADCQQEPRYRNAA